MLHSFIVALLVMAPTAHAGTPTERGSWEHKAQQLEAQHGVAIVFDALEFPQHWQAYDPQWTPVPVASAWRRCGRWKLISRTMIATS